MSVAGPFEKEGSTGTLLRFDYPDGDRFELLVDPESGASEWSRTVIDGRETWTRLSDWRELSGVRFALRQETFAEHTAENLMIRAVRSATPGERQFVAEYNQLKRFWGVNPHIETLLGEPFQALLAG